MTNLVKYITIKSKSKYRDFISTFFTRRLIKWPGFTPCISFTFDDFPRSASLIGAEIMAKYGLKATYYISLSLMNQRNQYWEFYKPDDLIALTQSGHELGSHTYDHIDAWYGTGPQFEESVKKNQLVFQKIIPGYNFKTLSFCTNPPNPSIKKIAEKYFLACRGGGNRINNGIIDLNLLSSFFIDRYHRDQSFAYKLIDKTVKSKGWLIFSFHDLSPNPSPFGCTPDLFKNIVQYAANSGAKILPVAEVIENIIMDSQLKS